ncbi:MAG: transposase zinc-binding domain-containing protein [Desulfococcaceae bacterium]|nr:transposase zinc-binding domain-containing protein [Desulfococcaceae bacterium]
MPAVHRKVINDIISCRRETCGFTVYECPDCRTFHRFNRSCGNRHCPVCQHRKAMEWTEKQLIKVLPGHHFMVTFTVPQQLRKFIRSHQKAGYGALFRASSYSLKKLSRDKKLIGGDRAGFSGVLHTWGRIMQYHPHVHYVVPGGALSSEDGQWHPSRTDFYLPVCGPCRRFTGQNSGT